MQGIPEHPPPGLTLSISLASPGSSRESSKETCLETPNQDCIISSKSSEQIIRTQGSYRRAPKSRSIVNRNRQTVSYPSSQHFLPGALGPRFNIIRSDPPPKHNITSPCRWITQNKQTGDIRTGGESIIGGKAFKVVLL